MNQAPDHSVISVSAQGFMFSKLREQGTLKKVNLFGRQKSAMAWSPAISVEVAEPIV